MVPGSEYVGFTLFSLIGNLGYSHKKDDFLLSVIIPVYNEAETIGEFLDRVTFAPLTEIKKTRR